MSLVVRQVKLPTYVARAIMAGSAATETKGAPCRYPLQGAQSQRLSEREDLVDHAGEGEGEGRCLWISLGLGDLDP
jgi:hypothetical protein